MTIVWCFVRGSHPHAFSVKPKVIIFSGLMGEAEEPYGREALGDERCRAVENAPRDPDKVPFVTSPWLEAGWEAQPRRQHSEPRPLVRMRPCPGLSCHAAATPAGLVHCLTAHCGGHRLPPGRKPSSSLGSGCEYQAWQTVSDR